MGLEGKTRLANRIKKFSSNLKKVDEDKRKSIIADKLNYLESDYYEQVNKMAEDDISDDYNADDQEKGVVKKKDKLVRKVNRKIKKESNLRKNFNLIKVIKEEALYDKDEPNFVNIRVKPSKYPARKYCSICGALAKSSCTRCGQRICRQKCWRRHSEIKCLNFQLQY